jgi:16S rRNA C967 or C1407 C5-methylase (RsmB/RsmF family)/NOL1/NOP2/fmu family ribosome biogenesis protein
VLRPNDYYKVYMHLPSDFLKQIPDFLPPIEQENFIQSLQTPPVTSIRLNPEKHTEIEYTQSPVAWCKTGYYLEKRPYFTEDPSFWAGAYYVQEASSMFLEQVIRNLKIAQEAAVLDLSAAPGGKSTHLLSLLPENTLLVSNEIIRSRADILQENLCRWGSGNYIVTQSEASVWGKLESFFDVILLDAPCSGEGMFRKEEQAIGEWSLENVNFCAIRQKEILQAVLPALAAGGYLIYSTCTYNSQENEANIRWLVETFDLEHIEIPIQEDWGIRKTSWGYRFFPHLLKGEGFFMACLRKKGQSKRSKIRKNIFTPLAKKEAQNLQAWLSENPEKALFSYQQKNLLLHPLHTEYISQIAQIAYIRHTALELGVFKQKDFIPTHDLAMSHYVSMQIPQIHLEKEAALLYLSKKDFALPVSTPKGWNIVKYKNLALGWVKVLGNRINNYYPTEIRIRNL